MPVKTFKTISREEIVVKRDLAAKRKEWGAYNMYLKMEQRFIPVMPLPGRVRSRLCGQLGLAYKVIKERIEGMEDIYPSSMNMNEVIDTDKYRVTISIEFKEPEKK